MKVDSRATDLLITSPTSDLSNLINMSQAARIHSWVNLSAKTFINTAEMALIRFPALKSVTILEHLPRYFLKAFSDFKVFCLVYQV